jgi:transcription elongation factor GreA
LGLRRRDLEANLDVSKETDDRGIGVPGVAVFLLSVTNRVRHRRDGPSGRANNRAQTLVRPIGTASYRWGATRMSNDRIPMSKEGYEKLKAQLDKMKHEDMPRIAEQIAQARGYGDLSENAEFDAAVEAQGMLQARINDLQNKLGQAYIVDKSTVPTDRVVYGSKVRVLDLEIDEEEDFILVGPGEEDYDQNKILLSSPIGQALVGKKIGEEVTVPIPKGVLKLKIIEIGVS